MFMVDAASPIQDNIRCGSEALIDLERHVRTRRIISGDVNLRLVVRRRGRRTAVRRLEPMLFHALG
jgi:hypothetical protein